MFPVHIRPEEFKNATVTSNFGFVFEENSGREYHDDRNVIVYKKLRSFQNVFRPHENQKPAILNSSSLKSVSKSSVFVTD